MQKEKWEKNKYVKPKQNTTKKIQSVNYELKEEIRVLKEAIPKLEEYIQGELGGKVAVHKISPQHRARRRRLATVQSSATSNSSEEAESEGG